MKSTNCNSHGVAGDFDEEKAIFQATGMEKYSKGTSALLVQGARRVGKSYLIEDFAKNEYKSYILIDFNRAGDTVKNLFLQDLDDMDTFF